MSKIRSAISTVLSAGGDLLSFGRIGGPCSRSRSPERHTLRRYRFLGRSPPPPKNAHQGSDQRNDQRRIDDHEIHPDIALPAAEPAPLHPGLIDGIEHPEDAGEDGRPAGPPQDQQGAANHRGEHRVGNEDGRHREQSIHSRSPYLVMTTLQFAANGRISAGLSLAPVEGSAVSLLSTVCP